MEVFYDVGLLNGVMVLSGIVKEIDRNGKVKDVFFKVIFYFIWNNCGVDQMVVWIFEVVEYVCFILEVIIVSKVCILMIQVFIQKDVFELVLVEIWVWGVND